jgi:hypothetical protein
MTGQVTVDLSQRKRIRRTAIGFALLALGFYFGFIALSVYRSRH